MRANTKKKHEMGKRFAIVIGVAAVGVMALGAQTAAQARSPSSIRPGAGRVQGLSVAYTQRPSSARTATTRSPARRVRM